MVELYRNPNGLASQENRMQEGKFSGGLKDVGENRRPAAADILSHPDARPFHLGKPNFVP